MYHAVVILSHTIFCGGQYCLSFLRLFNVAFEFLHLPHLHYSAVTAVLEDLFFFQDQNVSCQWNDSISLLFAADFNLLQFLRPPDPWHQTESTALFFSDKQIVRKGIGVANFYSHGFKKKHISPQLSNGHAGRQNTPQKKKTESPANHST